MNGWRTAYALGLLALTAVPLLVPFVELRFAETWTWSESDLERVWYQAANTLTLTSMTLALALPLGTGAAVLLFRTSFFARRVLLTFLALALFLPLPTIVSSWQGLLGSHGWLPVRFWADSEFRPWATGMGPAIWIHTVSALPWVAFIVGLGLAWVEPELEEQALQIVGPWRVLFLVSLPRARASILAAALFVALQTAGETNVTDIMLVNTLADEMRTQFALNERAGLARTLALALPGLLAVWACVLGALAYLQKRLPPPAPPTRGLLPLDLGPPWLRLVTALGLIALLFVPIAGLIWKLGANGHPPTWSPAIAGNYLRSESRVLGRDVLAALLVSAGTGVLISVLALAGCWLARSLRASRQGTWFRWLLFSVLTWVWVLPGPAIGIGLHDTIQMLVGFLPDGPWTTLLYHGPSPLPLMWVQTMRALPIAVIFLWPVVRRLPNELFEEARLHGAGPIGEWMGVVVPMTARAARLTALAAMALCLGEVSASARVETPGWQTFAQTLLDRMHYGIDNSLAALNLLMLASIAVSGIALFALRALLTLIARIRSPG